MMLKYSELDKSKERQNENNYYDYNQPFYYPSLTIQKSHLLIFIGRYRSKIFSLNAVFSKIW